MNRRSVNFFFLIFVAVIAALAAGWYLLFGLKPYKVTVDDIRTRYHYSMAEPVHLQLQARDDTSFDFRYTSFDGAVVNGRLQYPQPLADTTSPLPVLISAHAMGRNHLRWWQDNIQGSPTRESTHEITAMALSKGYAVITIDARHHGERVEPGISVRDIITHLHWWGKRAPYEQMLINTVRDHRVLLDWLEQQPQFDTIHIAGYSMGAHISLLLAGVDKRIHRVAAIVPPHVNNRTAIVAPHNMLAGFTDNPLLLLTANSDEYATAKQNRHLFDTWPNDNKQHVSFDSGHLLPADYVHKLEPWL